LKSRIGAPSDAMSDAHLENRRFDLEADAIRIR
jgi:hypothetical protein